jgi:hypothetical protein
VLTGSGFTGASEVDIGPMPVFNFTANNDTQLSFLTPPGPAGTWDVTVTTAAGTSVPSSTNQFTYTLAAVPTITSLSQNSGSQNGGTQVTITGTDLLGATAVTFGGVAASFTPVSNTSIIATAPGSTSTGTVDVTVTTYAGTSAVVAGDHFTYNAGTAPTVTSLATNSGSPGGGTLVTITGLNLTGASAVNFGTVAASFTVNSDGSITATAPPHASGTVDVTVTTPVGTSATGAADQFTYNTGSAPSITSLSTTTVSAAGGTPMVILGSNFTGASQVIFNTGLSVSALSETVTNFTINSDSSISLITPVLPTGVTVDVEVVTPSGTSNESSALTVNTPIGSAPSVTGVTPNSVSVSSATNVTITGVGFSGASAVKFGATIPALFTINSDTSITAISPSGTVGTVHVTVTTPNGTSSTSSADQFTWLSTAAPTVSSLGTTTGTTAGGASVGITGTNFTGVTAVYFGTVAASFTYNSSTSITAASPPQGVGTVDVTVVTPSGVSATSSSDRFTYTLANRPSVSSLGTTTGSTAGGTSVVISGQYFTGATGVFFGGVAATSFTVSSDTSITATSPAQYAGTVDVTVVTWAGTSAQSAGDRFAYTGATLPTISSLGTQSGNTGGGTSVAINGSHFTSAIGVTFGGVPAASFTINSDSLITAVSPPQAAGTVDVKVTTNAGTSATTSNDRFTVTAALPTVTGLSSSGGSTAGGLSLTITGTNFTGATGVSFGSVAVPFTFNSATSISVVSPPEPQGTVDVTVTTFAGTSATATGDHFAYTNAANPTVTGVTANSGSTVGGDVVTISGTNFTGATGVTFDNIAAAGFTVVSDTAIVAISPAHATTGTIDVQVTTYANTSATSAADHYTYNSASAPTITSLNPSTGGTGGGTLVTITGTNLLTTTGVSFGSTPAASFYIVSSTKVNAVAPPMAAGTYDVTVTTPAGTSALGGADRYVYTTAVTPSVTSLSTTSGGPAGGTSVTVTGTNFTGASSVTVGGVAVAFTLNSDTSLTLTTPPEAPATVHVIVTTPTGTSAATGGP